MKIKAVCYGDPAVGIFGEDIEVEISDHTFECNDQNTYRKELRNLFKKFADEYFAEPAIVWFSDECPDCFHQLIGGKCQSKNCIQYMAEKD